MLSLQELTSRHAGSGRLEWIGIRPARKAPLVASKQVRVLVNGLAGDHRAKPERNPGKRSITLIQAEHLEVIAALSGCGAVEPSKLRRNLVVSGINLLALKDRKFRIGSAEFLGTGICAPCSRMETALGHGGYNAMRGHGGITAEVLSEGEIRLGDRVIPAQKTEA
jgi:MOSC domain-containing protein YiiM